MSVYVLVLSDKGTKIAGIASAHNSYIGASLLITAEQPVMPVIVFMWENVVWNVKYLE